MKINRFKKFNLNILFNNLNLTDKMSINTFFTKFTCKPFFFDYHAKGGFQNYVKRNNFNASFNLIAFF